MVNNQYSNCIPRQTPWPPILAGRRGSRALCVVLPMSGPIAASRSVDSIWSDFLRVLREQQTTRAAEKKKRKLCNTHLFVTVWPERTPKLLARMCSVQATQHSVNHSQRLGGGGGADGVSRVAQVHLFPPLPLFQPQNRNGWSVELGSPNPKSMAGQNDINTHSHTACGANQWQNTTAMQ